VVASRAANLRHGVWREREGARSRAEVKRGRGREKA
jgi:hypothetical protein